MTLFDASIDEVLFESIAFCNEWKQLTLILGTAHLLNNYLEMRV